ncbi:Bromodomain-containing protein [Paraphysoderma sedebokerense]|nr:Bromodomain-containing protein [Paraphysoderma sedebokerense]
MLGSLFSKQSNNSTQSDSKPQLTKEQHKFCAGIVKNMKRHKDAYPFLVPVDPVKLNIPDYPLVITQPMDLSTIEKKLQNNEYNNADAFTADFLLMFNNTRKYNGSESVFAKMAGNLEKSLVNQMKKLPVSTSLCHFPSQFFNNPNYYFPVCSGPVVESVQGTKASRRPSEEPGRPKREIHPPSREIPTITPPLRKKSGRATDDIKFCHTVLKEMMKKQHAAFNSVFLEPVPRATYPIYYDVVKKPMDLGTMKTKLEAGEYSTAHEFEVDMRQIFKNCYKFNPPGTDVYNMGKRLEALFNTKWAEKNKEMGNGKPRKREKTLDMSSSDVESSSDEAASHIALMEKQLELMQAQLAQMKKEKKKKKKEKRERDISPAMMQPVARKSKPSAPKPPKVPKSSAPKKSKPAKRASEPPMYEEAEFTFEMKKELSESINTLPADRLTQVITIIQESMPELRDTNEEIELDISSLDSSTLWKLYRLVCNSTPAQSKTSRPATQKRKRMTDAEQSERLKMLEAQMAKFERQDSSSGSDSSDSDDSEDSGSDSD